MVGSGGKALERLNLDLAPNSVALGSAKDPDPKRAQSERSLEVFAPAEEAATRIVRNYMSTLSYVRSAAGDLVHTSKSLAVGAVTTQERFTPADLQKIERATNVTLEVGGEGAGGRRIIHIRGRLNDVTQATARLGLAEGSKQNGGSALYDVAPQQDGLAIRVPPWAMSRIALPETRKLVERTTSTTLQLKKTKEGDGKVVVTGGRDACEGAKNRILQAVGLDEWSFGPPSCPTRVEIRDPEICALLRAERELTDTVEVAGRALALVGMKGALNGLQEITQTTIVAQKQSEGDARRSVEITGRPEDVADAAGRLRFLSEELGRVERDAKGKGK